MRQFIFSKKEYPSKNVILHFSAVGEVSMEDDVFEDDSLGGGDILNEPWIEFEDAENEALQEDRENAYTRAM